jgi:hypothetical protein
MKLEAGGDKSRAGVGGFAGWLFRHFVGRLRGGLQARRGRAPRLAVVERISLAPRQTLALVEAEGRRFLVATSAEGTPAFYPLDEPGRPSEPVRRPDLAQPGGVSRISGPRPVRPATRPGPDRDARVSW